jgi:hypothetical protein
MTRPHEPDTARAPVASDTEYLKKTSAASMRPASTKQRRFPFNRLPTIPQASREASAAAALARWRSAKKTSSYRGGPPRNPAAFGPRIRGLSMFRAHCA